MNDLKPKIMDAQDVQRAIARISHEIIERNRGVEHLVMIGILTRGYPLAKRLVETIRKIEGKEIPLGSLDISLYRDDLFTRQPVVKRSEIAFDMTDKRVVLVDEVIFTGRTIRAALDAIMDFGRPEAVQLVVLIDRGHRELPVRPDYVGKNVPTSRDEEVVVKLTEVDGEDGVYIARPPMPRPTGRTARGSK